MQPETISFDQNPPWQPVFQDVRREHGFEPLVVQGRLPPDLSGTLYRNGPSRFGNADGRYGHWFDGDGAVSAVRMAGGRAFGGIRLLQSWHLEQERQTGRTSTLGFNTRAQNPLRHLWAVTSQRRRNPANTSLMWWQGELLALYEGGAPTRVDPEALESLGETYFDGVLCSPFSAHPSTAPDGTVYNFGVRYGRAAEISLYRLGNRVEHLRRFKLRGQSLVHDFVVTDRYAIFFVPPIAMQPLSVLVGLKTPLEAMDWRGELGTEIILVPLDRTEPIKRFTTDSFYQWHFANAYERGDEIVVDYVQYPDFSTNDFLCSLFELRTPDKPADGKMVRRTIDLKKGTCREETLHGGSCEFPCIDPGNVGRPHDVVYTAGHSSQAAAHGGFDQIVRVSTRSGQVDCYDLGSAHFVSEPTFVDGYLLVHVYDSQSQRTNLTVLDAMNPSRGPLARCWFDQPLPPTFHGVWKRGAR